MKRFKPIVLVILDGWGHQEEKEGNAILNANLPTFDKLDHYYPKVFLQASGLVVGLPWLQPGNSEVGHQILGTGQIIYQNLPRIFTAIRNGSFFKNKTLLNVLRQAKLNQTNLHFFGLVSDGGVHAHTDHLIALLEVAKDQGLSSDKIFIHVITDGRDTSPKSAEKYLSKVLNLNFGRIASISGRYYAMDRNKNWDRTEKAFAAMVNGKGILETNPSEAIKKQYAKKITDEFMEPIVLTDDGKQPIGKIQENDTVVFFNFRKDRARQITEAFVVPNFDKFESATRPEKIRFVCMSQYEKGLDTELIFPPQKITLRISEILSKKNYRQLKIAETEKYAHVTYFFNGGREKPFEGEDHILIPSKNNPSYAEAPEMSAREITAELSKKITENIYDFIVVNYANSDMVGHTGDLKAAVKAVETMGQCLKDLMETVIKAGGCLLVTADHGNVEQMINLKTKEINTQHSNNPVPCWLVTPDNYKKREPREMIEGKAQGLLIDIPPTILDLFDIKKPSKMRGVSLLEMFRKENPED
ncbi:MAG: 2,3-bisphosphoglycerate-independent phosphoglycerate mutase [Patescibacteria group bacterium]|nr:2,3-bisphosphoglycerate-independent phosphoglycerate mutase [Patescibacteria group bacterium]